MSAAFRVQVQPSLIALDNSRPYTDLSLPPVASKTFSIFCTLTLTVNGIHPSAGQTPNFCPREHREPQAGFLCRAEFYPKLDASVILLYFRAIEITIKCKIWGEMRWQQMFWWAISLKMRDFFLDYISLWAGVQFLNKVLWVWNGLGCSCCMSI